jgi:hypothetical protein
MPYRLQVTPPRFVRFVALCCVITEVSVGVLSAAQPIAQAPTTEEGQATTLTASGVIDLIGRQMPAISFFPEAPFWGPPRYGSGRVFLWPKNTAFILFIPALVPITLDGKKVSFSQLAVGQRVQVQYNIGFYGTRCEAYRIDARSPSPASHSGPSHKAKSRP